MSGKTGRSGGARPGTGPKPAQIKSAAADPLTFLLEIMRNDEAGARLRLDAAKVLLPHFHQRLGSSRVGKKDAAKAAAEIAARGRFAPGPAPSVVALRPSDPPKPAALAEHKPEGAA